MTMYMAKVGGLFESTHMINEMWDFEVRSGNGRKRRLALQVWSADLEANPTRTETGFALGVHWIFWRRTFTHYSLFSDDMRPGED